MILFEEKMMDANKIFFAEVLDNFNTKKVYYSSTLKIVFLPKINMANIRIDYKTHEEAISKLEQLTQMVNSKKK